MIRAAFLSLVLLLGSAAAGAAQPLPAGGPTYQEVADWLRGEGLDAMVNFEDEHNWVSSGANGVSWDVNGFDCEAGRCSAWQFSAAFPAGELDPALVNQWNRERRYLRAFSTPTPDDVAVLVQHDVLVTPGMGWEAMTEHLRLFAANAPLFAAHIAYAASGAAEARP